MRRKGLVCFWVLQRLQVSLLIKVQEKAVQGGFLLYPNKPFLIALERKKKPKVILNLQPPGLLFKA